MLHPPFKAPKLVLDHDARVYELAHAALRSAAVQVRRNSRGARIGKDPDYAHQLRVGVRRMRVCLRLFKKLLSSAEAARIEEDLRWIFGRLGAVREHDVLLSDVIAPLRAAHESEAVIALSSELTHERDRLAGIARHALSSRRYVRLLRALRLLPSRLKQHGEARKRARKWAKERLQRRLDAALSLRAAAFGPEEVARHELRKELKKLRYTAELMRGLWGTRRVKRYLEPLSALQDVLGALNDAAVGRSLLRSHGESASIPSQALDASTHAIEAQGAQHGAQLESAFAIFERARPYWR